MGVEELDYLAWKYTQRGIKLVWEDALLDGIWTGTNRNGGGDGWWGVKLGWELKYLGEWIIK